jgi:hypothetical protein
MVNGIIFFFRHFRVHLLGPNQSPVALQVKMNTDPSSSFAYMYSYLTRCTRPRITVD